MSSWSPSSSPRPPFVRALPVGLPPITEHDAEDLLETIWRGVAPD